MKPVITIFALTIAFGMPFCGISFGDENVSPNKMTAEQKRAHALENRLRHTGGFIRRPDTPQGKVYIFNAQKTVESEKLKKSVSFAFGLMKAEYKIVDVSESVAISSASEFLERNKASLGVFVVDNATDKIPLLVAPESRWAMVNIAALRTDSPKPAFLEARTNKELVRAILYVCGAAASTFPNSLMGAISKPSDLDQFVSANPPLDVVGRTKNYLPALGVATDKMVTYLKACQEGWAPAPTNKFQKAIWDKVHAPPEKPLKITYDKDKQKPVVK